MKNLFWLVVGILVGGFIILAADRACAEEAIAVGGMIHNGHSYSSDDKIDPPGYVGHGMSVLLEGGIDGERKGFDFTYALRIDAFRFGKRDNTSMQCRWETALVTAGEGRIYSRHNKFIHPYLSLALGTQVATDGYAPTVAGSFGFEAPITDRWSLEAFGRVLATDSRRHDTAGLLVKMRF